MRGKTAHNVVQNAVINKAKIANLHHVLNQRKNTSESLEGKVISLNICHFRKMKQQFTDCNKALTQQHDLSQKDDNFKKVAEI